MQQKQKGFSAVEFILILLVITAIGLVGWYVYSKQNKDTVDPNNTTSESSNTTELETAASQKGDYNWSTSPQGPYHDKVSYATSTDLLNWTDSGITIAEHASVPDVINKDGVLYAYYVDTTTDNLPEQIALITSSDNGVTWSEKQLITIKGADVATIVPVDPDPFLLPDGRIRIYYFDISVREQKGQTKNKIYSAVSDDGLTFTQEDGVRFEESSIYDPDVIKVGDTWHLYVGDPEGQKVISATSTDGLNFEKEGTAYSGSAVPNAFYANNQYYLYTAGIQIATSTDGTNYNKVSQDFRSSNGLTADPGVVQLNDGTYFMIYKTSDQKPQSLPAQ